MGYRRIWQKRTTGMLKARWPKALDHYNPPPASPKLDAQVIAYTDEGFSFLVYNYGEAPTILTAVDLSTYLERSTLHEGHAYFSLETPVPLPPSSNQTINIRYDSHQANWAVSFGSGLPVHQPGIPADALALPNDTESQSPWQLLGQCPNRALLQKPENGMDTRDRLSRCCCGEAICH